MSKYEKPDGELLYHAACIGDDCSSSDGMAVYAKEVDGNQVHDAYCFVCTNYFNHSQLEEVGIKIKEGKHKVSEVVDFTSIEAIPFRGWKERGIGQPVSTKYGVHTEIEGSFEDRKSVV